MLHYDRIHLGEGTDLQKSNKLKNVSFFTIDFLIMNVNVRIVVVMVVMI